MTAVALVLLLINYYCYVILVRIELLVFSIIYVKLIKTYVKYARRIDDMSHFQALHNGIFFLFYTRFFKLF